MRTATAVVTGLMLVLIGLMLVGCSPFVTIPGGELSGSLEPTPSDWSFSDAVETVQLETRPGDPYSVNVWGVGVGSTFYLAAGDAQSRWARNIDRDPLVRLKIGEGIYELRASRTDNLAEMDAFLAGAKKKYDFEPNEEQRANASLFRLEPR